MARLRIEVTFQLDTIGDGRDEEREGHIRPLSLLVVGDSRVLLEMDIEYVCQKPFLLDTTTHKQVNHT